jgi:hypothetical protein
MSDRLGHYVRGYEMGAEAALGFMAQEWPLLAEGYDGGESPIDAARAHIAQVVAGLNGDLPPAR